MILPPCYRKIVAYEACGRLPVVLICYFCPTDAFVSIYLGSASSQKSDRLEQKIECRSPVLWLLPSSHTSLASCWRAGTNRFIALVLLLVFVCSVDDNGRVLQAFTCSCCCYLSY
ncbi:hypothetical protein PVAP13_5KG761701 [Panicum virgatum]|uniref:Uncharacterized protein n=1 Tax=Panicum virgatum TaxID=38727 RepID=A0A8T0T242_PANVG|nr:hypothetical protein PVAP13_5KG761701 [Panicum virgatum]